MDLLDRQPSNRAARKPIETVLGLDLSSVCVGFSVFVNGKLVEYGKYLTVGKEHGSKLAGFTVWLDNMLAVHQPTQLVYEAPYAGHRRKVYGVLMLYVGAVLAAYWRYAACEVPAGNRIPPRQVKKLVGIAAEQTYERRKQAMVTYINDLYGLQLVYKANDRSKRISQDDVADSIAVVRAWLLKFRPEQVRVRRRRAT